MSRDAAVSVIVLAGGASRRMKRPKALLEVGGQTLVERVLGRVGELGSEAIVVSGGHVTLPRLPSGTRVIDDDVPLQGPATGIRNGLANATGELCFVTCCDQPFPNLALARHLIRVAREADLVIPRWEGHLQPLFAVYHRTLEGVFQSRISAGELSLVSIVKQLPFREIPPAEVEGFDPDGLSFVDVDTPAALRRALALAAAGK